MSEDTKIFSCSFCKRPKNIVKKLIAGRCYNGKLLFICDICINICYDALNKDSKSKNKDKIDKIFTPKEIYDEFCKYVEGQEDAKKKLATIAYNHYKRIFLNDNNEKIQKTNVLMIGQSGSGKTLLAECLGRFFRNLGIPYAEFDATQVTQTGYHGEDAINCLSRLFQDSGYDIEKTEKGIVFVDEVDKIRRSSNGFDGQRDISGADVQNNFLRLIEGKTISIPAGNSKKYGNQENVTINTENILFIFAGAFIDLVPIVAKEITNSKIGFIKDSLLNKEAENYGYIMRQMKNDHLIKFGLTPEFLGRIQSRIIFDELNVDNFIRILTEPEDSVLKQYKKLLKIYDNCELEWTKDALKLIAEKAYKEKCGARELKSIIEKILLPVMFDVPSIGKNLKVLIDEVVVKNMSAAKIINNNITTTITENVKKSKSSHVNI